MYELQNAEKRRKSRSEPTTGLSASRKLPSARACLSATQRAGSRSLIRSFGAASIEATDRRQLKASSGMSRKGIAGEREGRQAGCEQAAGGGQHERESRSSWTHSVRKGTRTSASASSACRRVAGCSHSQEQEQRLTAEEVENSW